MQKEFFTKHSVNTSRSSEFMLQPMRSIDWAALGAQIFCGLVLTLTSAVAGESSTVSGNVGRSEAKVVVERPSEHEKTPIALGVHVGANVGTVTFRADDQFNPPIHSSAGLAVGGSAEIQMARLVYLQPELNFIQKGATSGDDNDFTTTLKLNYLEIPVLAKIKLDAGMVHPFVLAGPGFSYLVGSTASVDYKGAHSSASTNSKEINKFDVTATIGLGADIDLGDSISAVFEGRYGRGFRRINSETDKYHSEIRNSGFQFLTGLQVSL